jgi:response regulator RpfG family c-di-GMP phosphodiesterase
MGVSPLRALPCHVKTGTPFLERVRALFGLAIIQRKNAHDMVLMRCERGADIARRIGLSETTALAIHSLDELWNGCGQPRGLRGEEIPLLARIMNLAQAFDVFYRVYGVKATVEMARNRSGRWFDPDLVRAVRSLAKKESLWEDVENDILTI